MSTLLLSEIIEKLKRLNAQKNEYTVRVLREELLAFSEELEKIADNLLV